MLVLQALALAAATHIRIVQIRIAVFPGGLSRYYTKLPASDGATVPVL